MTKDILIQLGHSKLLPPETSALLRAGNPPALSELVLALVIAVLDAHFITTGDPKSSWTERRLSHQNLANAFLLALLVDDSDEWLTG
jgi:hypothetical protein